MAHAEIDQALRSALLELGCEAAPQLTIGGESALRLAQRFGTPLYVFAADVLRRRVARIRQALGPRCELLWSVKANPSLAVTSCLCAAGVGAEIASLGELRLAIAAGHDPAELRFAGPGKSDHELEQALGLGLGTFHVESADELQSLAGLAKARGERARVAVRVNLPGELSGSRMRMGGHSSRFGVDVDQVPELLRTISSSDALELRGLHVYGGSQCFDAGSFVAQAAALCEHAARWQRQCSVRFAELDVGGGFGIAVFQGDPNFDLATAGRGLQEVVQRFEAANPGPPRRWFVELGRYLAAPAGVFLSRVVRCKQSGGQQHAVLDGGMHHAAAAAGLGTIMRRPPLLVAAEHLQANERQPVTLGGPLCTPADQFAQALELPTLTNGALVAILHAGAYGLSYSPTGFLSHPTPAEVWIDAGEARVVRTRGEAGDVLRGQSR